MEWLDTLVQSISSGNRGKSLPAVTDPLDLGPDEVMRVILDVSKEDLLFIEAYAAFRNALTRAQGKKQKRHYSRKSLAEQLISDQCLVLRHQLSRMFAELGPFPTLDPKDPKANRAAMEDYARRAVEWTKSGT